MSIQELEVGQREDHKYTADDPPLLFIPNCLYPVTCCSRLARNALTFGSLKGVAFTRSIGDMLGERIGVSAAPEVLKLTLGGDDRCNAQLEIILIGV